MENVRTFRGKKVLGWTVVSAKSKKDFEEQLNELMDEYEFVDTQYAISSTNVHSALILIAEN